MRRIALLAMDDRVPGRVWMLVDSHLRVAQKLAVGVASLFDESAAFAATQGAWRFERP